MEKEEKDKIQDIIEVFVAENFHVPECRECNELRHEIEPDDFNGSYDKAFDKLIDKLIKLKALK